MKENNKNENILKVENILKNIPRVENIQSNRGNDIPNQFIIYGDRWKLFQSYNSPIALIIDDKTGLYGKIYIFKDFDYSTTTGKYRNLFLNETLKETKAKLKNGEYIAVDFEVLK